MKMTITFHGINDDDYDKIISAVSNANIGDTNPVVPAWTSETSDDDPGYEVVKCRKCGSARFRKDLDKNGVCEDCADGVEA